MKGRAADSAAEVVADQRPKQKAKTRNQGIIKFKVVAVASTDDEAGESETELETRLFPRNQRNAGDVD